VITCTVEIFHSNSSMLNCPDQYLLVFQQQWQLHIRIQKQSLQASSEAGGNGDFGREQQSFTSTNYQDCMDAVNEFMKELVRIRLGPQLLKIVDVLIHRYPGGSLANHELTSSVLKNSVSLGSNHVALQFVKYISKILSLDTVLANEVAGLRRTLLTQLNIKEFNAQSEFEDPSVSYIMRDVICTHCNTCKDVDLLRDPLLSGKAMLDEEYRRSSTTGAVDPYGEQEEETLLASPKWQCSHCGNAYDVFEVEQRLLEDVERISASFLLQDFRCSKTAAVSTRFCTSQSDFCAPLVMDFDPESVKVRLRTLRKVAEFHEFEWLLETLRNLHA
jgi:DNA polymerase epsilon subunit 1